MAVSRRLRFEILRRDNHSCRYCGAQAPDVALTVDHITPVALGGSDDPSNLAAACADCNGGKTSIAPDSPHVGDVDQRALLWADAMKAAAAERAAAYEEQTRTGDQFRAIWDAWSIAGEPIDLPADWRGSVNQFLSAGLTMTDLEEMVDVAMNARVARDKVWRYFCGCCWRRAEQAQQRALELVQSAASDNAPASHTGLWSDAEAVDYYWAKAQTALHEALGLPMHACLCLEGSAFCGDLACRSSVIHLVGGLLLRGEDLGANLGALVIYDRPASALFDDPVFEAEYFNELARVSAALDRWRNGAH
ncbi:HNH endonuclease [Nocardia thailandica]|uniref:HNH endonuclease n=1 Tax=Nocardia thailandica TaxID=257275 RepID=A0ABW6PWY2_9NOCA